MLFSKDTVKRSIAMGMTAAVLVSAGLLSGCTKMTDSNTGNTKPEEKTSPAVVENKQDKIMSEFMALAEQDPKPDELIEFIDKNISNVSAKDASAMLGTLERAQESYLPKLEDRYNNDTAVQKKISDIFMQGFDMDKLYETKDPELKALLDETKAMGYKLETAEGMFFPIMNYEFLKKYSSYAEEDLRAYIDIMAVETNKVPAKDAALVIGWDEVVERALAQEGFIRNYGSSAYLGGVKKLQDKYITFMLYGLNNTPLFSYETKVMDPEAKAAFEKAVNANTDSDLTEMLDKYMELLEKSDYKLTAEVEKFRKEADGSK